MNILTNVVWRFKKVVPAGIEEFNKVITHYQHAILGEKASWKPEEIVIDSSILAVRYMAWLSGENELLDNEMILENEGHFLDKNNSDEKGIFQTEIVFELIADNELNFTALELMYKISHQVGSRNLGDRVYFEGLQECKSEDERKCFYLRCGS